MVLICSATACHTNLLPAKLHTVFCALEARSRKQFSIKSLILNIKILENLDVQIYQPEVLLKVVQKVRDLDLSVDACLKGTMTVAW